MKKSGLLILFLLSVMYIYSQCVEGNCQNGYGVYNFGSAEYAGNWKNYQMHGQGTYKTNNGIEYEGEFKNNSRTGYGVLTTPSGYKWKGEWRDDKRNGQGKAFRNGQLQRQGIWKNNEYTGTGCIEGDCQNGSGTFVYPTYERYIGEWKDGIRHGQGIFYDKDGKVYNGEWQNDLKHGKGKLVCGESVQIGTWKNGSFHR